MFCENCGAELNENTSYCNYCGCETNKAKYRRSLKKYRIISGLLAIVCISLLTVIIVLASTVLHKDQTEVETNIIELCGIYTIGDDEELPAGIYNITPMKGEREIDIVLYPDKACFDEEAETGIKSGESRWICEKSAKGYKLREGNIVEIDEPGAVFERID